MRYLSRIFKATAALAVFTVAVSIEINLPSQSVPWGTLNLQAPTGFFTDRKLTAIRDDVAMCHAALRIGGTKFATVKDEKIGECTLENRVRLTKSNFAYSGEVRANCGLVAALSVRERQVVAPAAEKYLASPVARIEQAGTFSCRTIRGSQRMSNHSTATAIDITGFCLKNGKIVSVLRDWGKGTAETRFLEAVRDGSCPVFRGVLGPDYNNAHKDHFHLDLGRFDICR